MNRDGSLALLPNLPVVRNADGTVVLTRKFTDGMALFQRYWDGRLVAVMEPTEAPTNNLDNFQVRPEDLPFGLEIVPFTSPKLREVLEEFDIVYGGVDYHLNHLSRLCRSIGVPCIYGAEYSLKTRRQIIQAEEPSVLRRWRRYVWEWNQERHQRKAIRAATGIQCNGTPVYKAYRGLTKHPFLFFDTRVTEEMIIKPGDLSARLKYLMQGHPLRLAFSGRLIPMKGADHLPKFARDLRRRGVEFELFVCGSGPLDNAIREGVREYGLQDVVHLKGVLDFATGLLPLVRNRIDLFICPHPQGDPSCTYLETLACGVPIVGYANEAFQGILERAPIGRGVPLNNIEALARAVQALDEDRHALSTYSTQALDFAQQYTFEQISRARIDHIRLCRDAIARL